MKNLKVINFYIFLLFLDLLGCATSAYKVDYQGDHSTELLVSADRILLECESLSDADIEGLYGFMIHVLDAKKTVLTVAQGNTLSKKSCDDHLKKIGKILRNGKKIYIAGMGDLKDSRTKDKLTYTFPKIGTFHGNGRVLQFIAIANENDDCYGAYYGEKKPCPRDPFPIKKRSVK